MGIKAVLLDIDGVLTIRDRVIEGAPQALKELRKNFKIALVTNTTRVPSRMIFERLRNLCFDLEREELFTALRASREFLVKNKANAYLLVSDMAKEEFYGKIQGKRP
jgi:Predicted sugar phosphatases of the HAD superfamily